MTGFCSDCGNTLCICDEIDFHPLIGYTLIPSDKVNVCDLLTPSDLEGHATACDYWERKALAMEQRIHDLEQEVACLKYSQWEPAEGIWRVSRNQYGRSSTMVAPLDVDEDEAIIRAVLHKYGDVAMRAIMDSYDKNKFCPTMLEHLHHDGNCGVWPSAFEIWESIRDAIAKDLESKSASED